MEGSPSSSSSDDESKWETIPRGFIDDNCVPCEDSGWMNIQSDEIYGPAYSVPPISSTLIPTPRRHPSTFDEQAIRCEKNSRVDENRRDEQEKDERVLNQREKEQTEKHLPPREENKIRDAEIDRPATIFGKAPSNSTVDSLVYVLGDVEKSRRVELKWKDKELRFMRKMLKKITREKDIMEKKVIEQQSALKVKDAEIEILMKEKEERQRLDKKRDTIKLKRINTRSTESSPKHQTTSDDKHTLRTVTLRNKRDGGFGFLYRGITVSTVIPKSSAEKHGLKKGDKIISINGSKLDEKNEFQTAQLLKKSREVGRATLVIERQTDILPNPVNDKWLILMLVVAVFVFFLIPASHFKF